VQGHQIIFQALESNRKFGLGQLAFTARHGDAKLEEAIRPRSTGQWKRTSCNAASMPKADPRKILFCAQKLAGPASQLVPATYW